MANSYDISSFGASIELKASKTFPNGISITQFADDADMFDIPKQVIAEAAMGGNGHMISHGKSEVVKFDINVIPGSEDDKNLQVLFIANQPVVGRDIARDVITATITFPDGESYTLGNGRLTEGSVGASSTNGGRKKSKSYTFAFQEIK